MALLAILDLDAFWEMGPNKLPDYAGNMALVDTVSFRDGLLRFAVTGSRADVADIVVI